MNVMAYKGYAASVEFSAKDDCFVGHVAGISDVVGFHATNVRDLRSAFHEAVDDYLETCKKARKPPQRPYSGTISLRLPPEVHARAAALAEASGKSLNQWATELIRVQG